MNETNLTKQPLPEQYVPLRKRFERAMGRLGLRLIVGPLRTLPLPIARKVGRGVGVLIYNILGRYRNVAHKNLRMVYGDQLDTRALHKMARDVFIHFGQVAAEFVKLPQLDRAEIDRLAIVEGEENLCKALEANCGVLMVTGHFGNWEFLSRWLSVHGYTLNVVARRANDPKADKLLRDTRTGGGAQVHTTGNSARAVLQCLKRKELVGILPDQNSTDVVVPFMGKPTGTSSGLAVIHLRTSAPIVFSWCVREPDGRFRVTFEAPEVIEPIGDKNTDVAHIMTLVNARLETQIRQFPTQWLWLHDRWRSSPNVFRSQE